MSEVQLGNLYELNKSAMKNLKPLTKEEIEDRLDDFYDWIQCQYFINDEQELQHRKYFMLLCNDLHDYTLFNLKDDENRDDNIFIMKNDILECLENRYFEISSIDFYGAEDKDDYFIEIWVRRESIAKNIFKEEENAVYCYYFFPYDNGVIEY